MPRPALPVLRKELLSAGVAPRHVQRIIAELDDHFSDLVDEEIATGSARFAAERQALERLGDLSDVASAARLQPELKSWAWRWPRVAAVVYPVAYVAALPAVPFVLGAQNAASVGRWLAGLLVAGFVTAMMFLLLQLSILLA